MFFLFCNIFFDLNSFSFDDDYYDYNLINMIIKNFLIIKSMILIYNIKDSFSNFIIDLIFIDFIYSILTSTYFYTIFSLLNY